MAVADIWDGIEVLVCDLDGVIYLGDEGIAGAGSALGAIAGNGIDVLFVTNNSTKTPQEVAGKIAATTGYAADQGAIVTSGVVTAAALAGKAHRALVVGGHAIDVALADVGIEVTTRWEEAEAVVVGLDRELTYDKLASATLALRNGALFYATNTDATYPTPQGQLPGGGVMVAALALSSGVSPLVFGKPEPAMCHYLADRVGGGVLVVGDRPETDVALARRAGWGSVLVLSGATASRDEIPDAYPPDIVLESIADLADLLA
jgi:HAD superfamily hydrolase (TIGR01450 family)